MHNWYCVFRFRIAAWIFLWRVKRLRRSDPERAFKLMRRATENLIWHIGDGETRAHYLALLYDIDEMKKAKEHGTSSNH